MDWSDVFPMALLALVVTFLGIFAVKMWGLAGTATAGLQALGL